MEINKSIKQREIIEKENCVYLHVLRIEKYNKSL